MWTSHPLNHFMSIYSLDRLILFMLFSIKLVRVMRVEKVGNVREHIFRKHACTHMY